MRLTFGDGSDGRWAEQMRALWPRAADALAAVRANGDDVAAMLKPPLYQVNYDAGLGTVYTGRYRPGEGQVTYCWPGEAREQSFADFAPGTRTVTLG